MAYLDRIFEHVAEDVTIPNPLTFSGTVTFTGSTSITATAVAPSSDDGQALGSVSLRWSDLFLASGAVINFDNGDVTLTHGSNALTIAGGVTAFSDATEATAVDTASVKFAGGIGVAKKMYLGTDLVLVGKGIDMSTAGTGVYNITLKTNMADALSIKDSAADMIVFDTSTGSPAITLVPNTSVTGGIDSTDIGANTPGTGAFSTLAAVSFVPSTSIATTDKTPINAVASVGKHLLKVRF